MYRAGKSYSNANSLSRLSTRDIAYTFSVVVVKAEEEFLKEISAALSKNLHFGRIYKYLYKQVKNSQYLESGP